MPLSLALCLTAVCLSLAAETPRAPGERAGSRERLRSTNTRIIEAIREGERKSPTFRAVVRDIRSRDVVVYLLPGNCTCTAARSCLTFLTTAEGLRYVLVRTSLRQVQPDVITSVAHELAHVAEVGAAPEIDDVAAFGTFYDRRGYRNCTGCGYETKEAIATERAVRTELGKFRD